MIISGFEFITPLRVERKTGWSKYLFYTYEPYTVSFRLDGMPTTYTVPAGIGTDFASIPRFAWRLIDRLGPIVEPAVVHDYMCIIRGPWSSIVAADVFNEGMRAAGMPDWQRELAYRAVRYFGPQWE